MPDARSLPDSDMPGAGVRMVGLGASAGGLAPLEQFLSQVRPPSGMAYLVVQHLDPTHKTLLGELLQRTTAMPVHEATDGQRILADSVYIIPPGAEMTVQAGALKLARPAQPRGQRLPVDVLFASLAQALGSRAIGVVMSGMGSDGTLGLQAIKAQGGLTLAQPPESAQFDSMPRSAIASGCVDVVALPDDMPLRIQRHTRTPAAASAVLPEETPPAATPEPGATDLQTILALVVERTRHDLSQYKANTLVRRIERRQALHGLASTADYADFLRTNPQELDLLFQEMLIGVTSFFRDPDAWKDAIEQVLPPLLERHAEAAGPLRAWVVGCSTGEEAYSLAMAFIEAQEAMPARRQLELQIFATDLNADAIAVARAGRYPASVARDLSPERLARFFTQKAGGLHIDKRLRDMVLFAVHDATTDPPFTRLDFLSCRNLLIYLGSNLQKRLIPLFHYSLRPGGALMLGTSETIGRAHSLFQPLHTKSRLYWRNDHEASGSSDNSLVFPTHRRRAVRSTTQETAMVHPDTPPANLQSLADHLLLQTYTPAAVLVNEAGDIVYVSGSTGRYLEPAAGKANWNIHVMARQTIRTQLALALRTALNGKTRVELHALQLAEDAPAAVDITVQAVLQPHALAGMAMIVFRDLPPATTGRRRRGTKPASGDEPALAEALLRARQEIDALRQETRSSHEELQAANEELQSTNEELQSANEELTTSKEEAQSMNEELQTINGELQTKLDDLALAQSDMQNLLNSTDIATLFLDNHLNVRRYTEQIARVVHLRPGDIGRPLSELASTLLYPELHADVKETLRTLVFSEKQIATSDGHWFAVRIMPYRTLADVIQGVVITFVDITVAKELESRLRKA